MEAGFLDRLGSAAGMISADLWSDLLDTSILPCIF